MREQRLGVEGRWGRKGRVLGDLERVQVQQGKGLGGDKNKMGLKEKGWDQDMMG